MKEVLLLYVPADWGIVPVRDSMQGSAWCATHFSLEAWQQRHHNIHTEHRTLSASWKQNKQKGLASRNWARHVALQCLDYIIHFHVPYSWFLFPIAGRFHCFAPLIFRWQWQLYVLPALILRSLTFSPKHNDYLLHDSQHKHELFQVESKELFH
jgi:hypothetical protein